MFIFLPWIFVSLERWTDICQPDKGFRWGGSAGKRAFQTEILACVDMYKKNTMTTLRKNKEWALATALTAMEHSKGEREVRCRTKKFDFYPIDMWSLWRLLHMTIFGSGKVFLAEIWRINWKSKMKAETSFQKLYHYIQAVSQKSLKKDHTMGSRVEGWMCWTDV